MSKSRLLTIACGVVMIIANLIGTARDDASIEEMIDEKLDERLASEEKGGD